MIMFHYAEQKILIIDLDNWASVTSKSKHIYTIETYHFLTIRKNKNFHTMNVTFHFGEYYSYGQTADNKPQGVLPSGKSKIIELSEELLSMKQLVSIVLFF